MFRLIKKKQSDIYTSLREIAAVHGVSERTLQRGRKSGFLEGYPISPCSQRCTYTDNHIAIARERIKSASALPSNEEGQGGHHVRRRKTALDQRPISEFLKDSGM